MAGTGRRLSRLASAAAALAVAAIPTAAWAAGFTVTGTIPTAGTSDVVFVNGFLVQAKSGSVYLFDPSTKALAYTLSAPGTTSPDGAATRGTKAYFANRDSDSLTIVDTVTRGVTVVATPACQSPDRILIAGSRLYMPCTANARVQSVNLDTEAVINTLAVGNLPRTLSFASGRVFVPNENSNTVTVITDAATPSVLTTLAVGSQPVASATLGTKAFVANFSSGTVSVIDAAAATPSVTATLVVGSGPQALAPCAGSMVVTNRYAGTGSFINPSTNAVATTTFTMGSTLHVVEADSGTAYFGDYSANTVSAVDCATQALIGTIAVTNPWFMAFDLAGTSFFPPYTSTPIAVASLSGASAGGADRLPPDWLRQVGRTGEACEPGWGPSWAMWPNGGTGGPVCSQMLTWSRTANAYVTAP